jgi:hypothetical protein
MNLKTAEKYLQGRQLKRAQAYEYWGSEWSLMI